MRFLSTMLFLLFCILAYAQKNTTIKVIPVDKSALSGIDLKPVKNDNQPERRLFQRNIMWGRELGVFVVSSETATAHQDNYAMEEFIFLLNGRSRMNPENGEEVLFNTGDYFVAPKGFTGEWETQGGDEFLIELSVIATDRPEVEIDKTKTLPFALDKDKLSGYGIELEEDQDAVRSLLFKGVELTAEVEVQKAGSYAMSRNTKESLVQVLSGMVEIIDADGESNTFYKGDWFILPQGFTGNWESKAHGLFRSLQITRS